MDPVVRAHLYYSVPGDAWHILRKNAFSAAWNHGGVVYDMIISDPETYNTGYLANLAKVLIHQISILHRMIQRFQNS